MNYCQYCKNNKYCQTYGTNCDYYVEQFNPKEALTEKMLDEIYERNYELNKKIYFSDEELNEDEIIEVKRINRLVTEGKL